MRIAMLTVGFLIALASGAWAQPAMAQTIAAGDQQAVSATATSNAATEPDLEGLPVSIERIKKQLAQVPPVSQLDALRLAYYIEVYGRATGIDLFKDFDVKNGPVPYGAMTHSEFLQLVTPQEFRSPPVDLTKVVMALVDWMRKHDSGKK